MATNPRTRNSGDPAVSAIEDALGVESDAGYSDPAEARPPTRRAEATRRDVAQRSQGSRIPAPPRRSENPRRAADIAAPATRRGDPRLIDDDVDDDERVARSDAASEDDADQAPPPLRPRAAERLRGRFAANDDRRLASTQLGLQRKPSRLIYPIAGILSAGWV